MDNIFSFDLRGIKINMIICSNIKDAIQRYFMLRSYVSSLPEEKREKIESSMAFFCKLKTNIISDKYYFIIKDQDIPDEIFAHEAFHMALRIFYENYPHIIIESNEEDIAYLIQDCYRAIKSIHNGFRTKN